MKKWWWLISGVLLAYAACKTKKNIDAPMAVKEDIPESASKPACEPVVVAAFQTMEDSAGAQVAIPKEVYQDGNCLRITYQYSGCQEGKAKLVWNGLSLKSYPPQALLAMYVSDVGDCERLLEGFGEFDLNVLAQHTDSIVMLRFRDFDGRLPYYLNRD
jgi:hypothetical protein